MVRDDDSEIFCRQTHSLKRFKARDFGAKGLPNQNLAYIWCFLARVFDILD